MINASSYKPVLTRSQWTGITRRKRIQRWLIAWRPWAMLAVLFSVWYYYDPGLIEPPALFSAPAEPVSGSFTRCGPGRGVNCVIDGDTIKLGERKVRIIGIDAPEVHPPRCAQEQQAGEAATAALQNLLNQGAFVMVGRLGGGHDMYGRDLRSLSRVKPDGSTQSIAEAMLATGLVRSYLGGLRGGWC